MKATKAILYATSGFLVLIWLTSFTISYVSLVDVALTGGIVQPYAILWPLCLDAFMSIASLDVIRRELNGEPTLRSWFVVVAVTLVSTAFNITRADPSALSWSVHALAPIVCFASFEIEMGVLRSHFRQSEKAENKSDNNLKLVSVAENVTENMRSTPEVPENIDETPEMKSESVRKTVEDYYKKHPAVGYAEAGKELGLSRQIVRAYALKISGDSGEVSWGSDLSDTIDRTMVNE
jgi:hypothetical protein